MHYLIFFILSAFSSAIFATTPTYIKPLGKNQAEIVFKSLKKEQQNKILEYPGEVLKNIYEADIMNNGNVMYVFTTFDEVGTMHANKVVAVSKDHAIQAEPPKPDDAGDGPFYFYTYTNPSNQADKFLSTLHGKTYMSFALGENLNHRDTFIWKNGKTLDACDSDWMNFEKSDFNFLYQNKKYNQAYEQLSFYLKKCKTKMDAKNSLWIKNDLALTAARNGDKTTCKTLIAEIEKDPAFTSTTANFKKSIAFNKDFCTNQTLITKKIHEKNASYSIDADYPQLTGDHLSKEDIIFNEKIKSYIQNEINEFKAEAIARQKDPNIDKDIKKEGSYLNITSQSAMIHRIDDLIGIGLYSNFMWAGDAHPGSSLHEFNYNLTKNKWLNLSYLLEHHKNYLKEVADYIQNNLDKIYTIDDHNNYIFSDSDEEKIKNIKAGLTANTENYKHWYFIQNGIRFCFEEYHFNVGRMPAVCVDTPLP